MFNNCVCKSTKAKNICRNHPRILVRIRTLCGAASSNASINSSWLTIVKLLSLNPAVSVMKLVIEGPPGAYMRSDPGANSVLLSPLLGSPPIKRLSLTPAYPLTMMLPSSSIVAALMTKDLLRSSHFKTLERKVGADTPCKQTHTHMGSLMAYPYS